MKKVFCALVFCCLGLAFEDKPVNKDLPPEKYILTTISLNEFDKLVAFINRKGFVVKERGVPSDRQYTFFDPEGNRHAFVVIRRNNKGLPDVQAPVSQISVWAYKGGVRDDAHFFDYIILHKDDRAYAITNSPDSAFKKTMTSGFTAFMKVVNR